MPDTIRDGTGSGSVAKVTSNKLDVSARANARIYYASRENGKAFIIQFELTQATGGATEGVGYIKYTGVDRLNIKQVSFTSEDSAMTKFGVWKNPTVSGGLASLPTNMNFGSNNSPNVTCAEDADGTTVSIVGGTSLYTIRTNGPDTKIVDFYDAIILGTNDIIAFKGNAATTASTVRVNIMFAESIT